MLIVLTGGARSGKSTAAVRAAARSDAPVTFIATATAGDEEMRLRIDEHARSRPPEWALLEEPVDLATAVASVQPDQTIIVDCLALWVSNRLEDPDEAVLDEARRVAAMLEVRPGKSLGIADGRTHR